MIMKTTTTTEEKHATTTTDEQKKTPGWATTGGRPRGREKSTVSTPCGQGSGLARQIRAAGHHLVCSVAFMGFSDVLANTVSDARGG